MTNLSDDGLIQESGIDDAARDAPLLITGCARSGTSALARFLSTHRRFCIFNEYSLYYQSADDMSLWHRIRTMREDNPPPKKVSSDVATLKRRMLEELPLPASNETTRNWLFGAVQNSSQIHGDKMPYNYLANMHEIVGRYPRAKFLITLRDGRAVIASQIRQFNCAIRSGRKPSRWMKPSVAEAQYLWLRSAKAWLRLRSNPPAPCLEIRYEQSVQSPADLAKAICAFVGITYRADDFREFFDQYRPVNAETWREEIKDIEDQLSDEFLDALGQLGYI